MNSLLMILKVVCFLLCVSFSNSDIYQSPERYLVCCPGFVWNNKESKCKQCDAGTIGPHCEIVCPYPWYGKQCLSKCNCSKDHCDPADGCIGWTTKDSLAGHSATSSRAESLNVTDITWQANTSRHQTNSKDNKYEIDGFSRYFIFSTLVVALIMCLLYVRLVFRCRFEHF